MEPTIWHGCYNDNWKGFITDASHAHPAKFSKALIERIYDHLSARGYITKGDVVGDPFGGVGTGALVAAYRGMRHVSVELEPKFVKLAQENFERHESRLRAGGFTPPTILQGDSRRFHLLTLEAIVTSPPYADSINSSKSGIDWTKAKRPERWLHGENRHAVQASADHKMKYGQTEGQIGALKSGDISAVISSPPYAGIAAGAGGLNTKPPRNPGDQGGRSPSAASQSGNWSKELLRYGDEPGQVARLDEGSVDAVVSSPPFLATEGGCKPKMGGTIDEKMMQRHNATASERYGDHPDQVGNLKAGSAMDAIATSPPYLGGGHHPDQTGAWNKNGRGQGGAEDQAGYGKTEGQIGQADKETYWQAMCQIYQSCFLALRTGGVLVLVLKDFVKDKKRMRLCDDTATLLKHCGFVELERIHAMLTSETREGGLFGGDIVTKKERKSFFRRLHEAKVPEVDERRIDWEEVLIFQKPAQDLR
jgi:16S rRNA G966 N2-methylase RsmD